MCVYVFVCQVSRNIYEKNPGPNTDIPLSEVYVRLGDCQRFNGMVRTYMYVYVRTYMYVYVLGSSDTALVPLHSHLKYAFE
jgi:hypothetical protein